LEGEGDDGPEIACWTIENRESFDVVSNWGRDILAPKGEMDPLLEGARAGKVGKSKQSKKELA